MRRSRRRRRSVLGFARVAATTPGGGSADVAASAVGTAAEPGRLVELRWTGAGAVSATEAGTILTVARGGPVAPPAEIRRRVETYLAAQNVCALGTGPTGTFRCIPIEYDWLDGRLVFLTEGGGKIARMIDNLRVSIAVAGRFEGWSRLSGLQAAGPVASLYRPRPVLWSMTSL